MRFSELLQQIRADGEDAITLDVPSDWMQGRALFGGLQAVLGLQALRRLVPHTPLRTLQTTFVAPPAGTALRARARLLRQGKNATHAEAHLLHGDTVLAVVLGVFGEARPSIVVERPTPRLAPESPLPQPYVPGLSPTFAQYFRLNWHQGSLPYSASPSREGIVRVDMPDETASTEAHIIALADCIPPLALTYMRALVQGSSLTWMLELLTDRLTGLPLTGWQIDARLVAAGDGYTSQSLSLFAPDGQAIALSRQSMVVFG